MVAPQLPTATVFGYAGVAIGLGIKYRNDLSFSLLSSQLEKQAENEKKVPFGKQKCSFYLYGLSLTHIYIYIYIYIYIDQSSI